MLRRLPAFLVSLSFLGVVACADDGGSGGGDTDTDTEAGDGDGDGDGDTDTEGDDTDGPIIEDEIHWLFATAPQSGDLVAAGGGTDARESADALCMNEYDATWSSEFDCANALFALVATEGTEIRDLRDTYMPNPDYPVQGAGTGTVVTSGPGALFNGTLEETFATAGVTGELQIWTGTGPAGAVGETCSDWSGSGLGGVGATNALAPWWTSDDVECSESRPILCLCI